MKKSETPLKEQLKERLLNNLVDVVAPMSVLVAACLSVHWVASSLSLSGLATLSGVSVAAAAWMGHKFVKLREKTKDLMVHVDQLEFMRELDKTNHAEVIKVYTGIIGSTSHNKKPTRHHDNSGASTVSPPTEEATSLSGETLTLEG